MCIYDILTVYHICKSQQISYIGAESAMYRIFAYAIKHHVRIHPHHPRNPHSTGRCVRIMIPPLPCQVGWANRMKVENQEKGFTGKELCQAAWQGAFEAGPRNVWTWLVIDDLGRFLEVVWVVEFGDLGTSILLGGFFWKIGDLGPSSSLGPGFRCAWCAVAAGLIGSTGRCPGEFGAAQECLLFAINAPGWLVEVWRGFVPDPWSLGKHPTAVFLQKLGAPTSDIL